MHERTSLKTPTGLQSLEELAVRRRFVALSCLTLYAVLLGWLVSILDMRSAIDDTIVIAFAIAAPWTVLGVCNAVLGFWLLHFHPDGLREVAPFAAAGAGKTRLRARTAMLLTIRNENVARTFARLRAMQESINATGEGAAFDWFVLSDTSDPEIAASEEAALAHWRGEARVHYRRRADNIGYKAGNIRDFCERWGAAYEFMIPLDADSLMDGATILALVRHGEAHPNIGILQSLYVGAPSGSAFARICQFGMRAEMRVYAMGSTWWCGDCGPYAGHNALVRVAPFVLHCELPKLQGNRHILAHDFVEAVLMRRAGYEVRLLPLECGSFEETPPTLLDFIARDLRWCEGNMQYFRLLGTPGLLPMSRFQLVRAIVLFIGAPAFTAVVALVALKSALEDMSQFPANSAAAFYVIFLLCQGAPKFAGFVDVVLSPGALVHYGGAFSFCVGALVEICCYFIISTVATLSETLFLCMLLFGRSIGWRAQVRDARGLSLAATARVLWPHFLFGVVILATAGWFAPRLLTWSLPLTLGYVVAIPFTLVTASSRVGAWIALQRICATPEELALPEILRVLSHRNQMA